MLGLKVLLIMYSLDKVCRAVDKAVVLHELKGDFLGYLLCSSLATRGLVTRGLVTRGGRV